MRRCAAGAPVYDARVRAALGLAETDQILGFLYVGPPVGGNMAPESCLVEWRGPAG